MKKIFGLVASLFLFASCISTKSTLKNVDDNAPVPQLTKNNTFVITAFSKDKKYGYDKDYPINIFYRGTKDDIINQQRFLNAFGWAKRGSNYFFETRKLLSFPFKKTRKWVLDF